MTQTLSIRIDTETEDRRSALAKLFKRSKSHLAAEAIEAYLVNEKWQLGEL
jgi:predicted transcriptional regulator